MSEPMKSCTKCNGSMEEGFIPDLGDKSVLQTSDWYEGLPERPRWFGRLKTSGKRRFLVRSYRCTRCGYIESYAI
jgi:hypothetical protein